MIEMHRYLRILKTYVDAESACSYDRGMSEGFLQLSDKGLISSSHCY